MEGAAGVALWALPASGAAGSLTGWRVMNAMAAVIRLAPMMATPMNVGRGCLAYSAKHSRSHFMAVLVGASRAGPFPPGCASCQRPGILSCPGSPSRCPFGQGNAAARASPGPGLKTRSEPPNFDRSSCCAVTATRNPQKLNGQ